MNFFVIFSEISFRDLENWQTAQMLLAEEFEFVKTWQQNIWYNNGEIFYFHRIPDIVKY